MQKVLSKREKIILYFIFAIFPFSIVFNFLIAPVLNKYEFLNKEIAVNRTKLTRQLRLLSKKEAIQSRYSRFSSKLKPLNQEQDTYLMVLSELENLAKDANIRIIDIRPEKTGQGKTGGYNEILINLRTEGGIEEYMKFIYNVENSLGLLKIKRLQLTSKLNNQWLEGDFSISQISYSD